MKLAWMGEYREMVEALIHYCNIYAAAYKVEKMEFQGVSYSYAQIQVLEYLLENEERNENMSAIAARLGITRSNFTKIVNRLVAKGLLDKAYMPGSRKALKLTVNDLGRELYTAYSQDILRCIFRRCSGSWRRSPRRITPPSAMRFTPPCAAAASWRRRRAVLSA